MTFEDLLMILKTTFNYTFGLLVALLLLEALTGGISPLLRLIHLTYLTTAIGMAGSLLQLTFRKISGEG